MPDKLVLPAEPKPMELLEILREQYERMPEGSLIQVQFPNGYVIQISHPADGRFEAGVARWRAWGYQGHGKTIARAMEELETKVMAHPVPGEKSQV